MIEILLEQESNRILKKGISQRSDLVSIICTLEPRLSVLVSKQDCSDRGIFG